jgi:hypothetical protein
MADPSIICCLEIAISIFQYKICKLKETQLCNFCNETQETILHLFWECNFVKSLWLEMAEILKKQM